MQALVGLVVFLVLAWAVSEGRRNVVLKPVLTGLFLQFLLALLLFKIDWIAKALGSLNSIVAALEAATVQGSSFLFGYLGGGQAPFEVTQASATYLFAFRVLPQVIVFSVVIAILWYWRVLPLFVRGFGWLLKRSLGISGALGTAGASTLFLGMVETPLVIRAYLKSLTRSEYFTVMTFGMSTVAGSVMVLYASVLVGVIEGIVGHIIAASVLNIVGAIYVARIMVPETDDHSDLVEKEPRRETSLRYQSFMDAVSTGTGDGLNLAVNVGASLLVLLSLVALVNGVLGFVYADLSLQQIFGWLFAPVAWLVGIPWQEAVSAGSLLGTKLVLNELVAYLELAELHTQFTDQTRLIMTYALCGFANFGSLGILLGGLSTLVPERIKETLEIAPKSLISGTIVSLITASMVALVSQI
jgi:CNT family concentrative nucleoside transporter